MWQVDSVRLRDFKSFGGQHELGPLGGFRFSCVVGLNGSGKSNLMDALSFVLGLNNRQLRTQRFLDLCHRAPDAAAGTAPPLARVAIRFRRDEEELVLERRVLSDSATAWFVNDAQVDKATYNAKLQEIGVVGRNCLVAQGHVESISTSTPKDRSHAIDLLSGSAHLKDEYDRLSKEANELAAALKIVTTKKQDADAEFRIAKRQLDVYNEYESLKTSLANSKEKLQAFELYKQLCDTQAALQALQDGRQRFTELQDELKEQRALVDTLHKQRNDGARALRQLQQAKAHSEAERDHINEALQSGRTALRKLEIEEQAAQREAAALGKQLETVTAQRQKATEDRQRKLKEIEAAKAQNEYLKASPSEQKRVVKALEGLKNEARYTAQLKSLEQELEYGRTQKEKLVGELVSRQSETEGLVKDIERAKDSHEEVLGRLAAAVEAERKMVAVHEEQTLTQKLREVRIQLNECRDRLAEDTSTQPSVLGSCEAMIRELGTDRVFGRVSELVKINDPQYITAINTALGRQRSSIVVSRYEDAIVAVNYLKANRLGVEEFIPVGSVMKNQPQGLPALRRFPDLFVPAADCVSTSVPHVLPAIHSILGDTVIVKGDINFGREIAFRRNLGLGSLRIVTLDGQKISKNANVTLSHHQQSAVRDTREGRDVIKARAAELENTEKQLSTDLRRIVEANRKSEEENDRLDALVRDLRSEAGLADIRYKEYTKLLAVNEQSQRELNEGIRDLDAKAADLAERKMETLETMSRIRDAQIHDVRLRRLINSYESFQQLTEPPPLSSHGPDPVQLQQKRADVEANVARQRRAIAELQQSLEQLTQKLDSTGLEAMETQMRELTAQKEAVEGSLAEAQTRLDATMTLKSNLDRDRYLQITKVNAVKSAVTDPVALQLIEGAFARLDAQEDCSIEFDSVGRFHRKDLAEVSEDLLKARIQQESEAISGMNVSMSAPEVFEKARQALEEAVDAYDLAKNSKHAVDSDLVRVREKRKRLFSKCFDRVNELLDVIYGQLTGVETENGRVSGTASLELEDELCTDPFLKGILFHAIPPGKRYTHIETLSGGEKTMAALALVFSMQLFNKAPFLVLDEVDAALDLDNVTALREYLRAADVQVIMVSLKEEIYSYAEALVGVYKDPGSLCSQTLTVDLRAFPLVQELPLSVQSPAGTSVEGQKA